MQIACYVQLHRTIRPTGVGKHLIHMVSGLAATPGMDLRLLVDRRFLDKKEKIPADSPLAGLPVHSLKLPRTILEKSWAYLNWPKMDRAAGHPDWIYCPTEVYVPSRKSRLAVTVHDVHFLEPELPWSNTPAHLRSRRRWEPLMRRIVRDADLIVTVSQFTKLRMIELLGADAARIEVVGNGVDVEACMANTPVQNQAMQSFVAGGPYLAMVGGLSTRKGINYVLAFADQLAKVLPRMRILVAGSPQGAPSLAARPNITELDYVSEEQLPGFLRGATALLFLSRYEGFGIPAIEAMAAGTPVIASSFGALPEVVGDAGIIVDATRPEEVVEAVRCLAADEALRSKYITLGRARSRQYTWNVCVDRLADALRRHG